MLPLDDDRWASLTTFSEARFIADDALEAEPDEERRPGLFAMRAALSGDADLAWSPR